MARQAIKKGSTVGVKKTLTQYKERTGFSDVGNANKPMTWITMPPAFQEALKLPGIPEGTVVSCQGHSNSGKSSLISTAIASAQKMGLGIVIYDTENNFSFNYARSLGFQCEPVYGDVEVEKFDPETGEYSIEVERQVVSWEGDFIYYNNYLLAQEYGNWDYGSGKKVKEQRKSAVIEDIAMSMNELLDAQDKGEIEQGLLFIWDSVGSVESYRSFTSSTGNNMFDAGALSVAFNRIVNDRIPRSRKTTSKYNNTFLYVNKIWMDSMTVPTGPAIMRTKGGNSLHYATRLQILCGKQLTAGVKKLKAVYKGQEYVYASQCHLSILKNHLDDPWQVTFTAPIVITANGYISPSDVESYKKGYMPNILKSLSDRLGGGEVIDETKVSFVETDDDE